jgi:hypothetical protein
MPASVRQAERPRSTPAHTNVFRWLSENTVDPTGDGLGPAEHAGFLSAAFITETNRTLLSFFACRIGH